MKTKSEIKKAIKRIRNLRNQGKLLGQKTFVDICNGQIRALQWAMGYKLDGYYWCVQCQIQHKGLKCPKCQNEALIVVEERG